MTEEEIVGLRSYYQSRRHGCHSSAYRADGGGVRRETEHRRGLAPGGGPRRPPAQPERRPVRLRGYVPPRGFQSRDIRPAIVASSTVHSGQRDHFDRAS
jgi:hypothetical protein